MSGPGGLEVGHAYDGAGNRVEKTVNGVRTVYWVDPFNAVDNVPQVLVEEAGGEAVRYLYGLDLLGEVRAGTPTYYGYDALSIRLGLGEGGALTARYRYAPFGEVVGKGPAGYGFTGERWDGEVGLLYLRARYYRPAVGRFVSRDPWPGTQWRPQTTLHGYIYTGNSPVNTMDPSGLSFFPWPWDWPAEEVVLLAKRIYSKRGPVRYCAAWPDDGQWPSDTVDDLLTDYICEYGPAHRRFGADAFLTQQLARSDTLYVLRKRYYDSGGGFQRGWYIFGVPEYLRATIDTIWEGEMVRSAEGIKIPRLNITHFLGTFYYEICRTGRGQTEFWIENDTTLESGTRIPPVLGGASPGEREATSVEEILEANPALRREPLRSIMADYRVISILKTRTRYETTDPEGGGRMKQTFHWCEPPETRCYLWMPWPTVLLFLHIEPCRYGAG